MCGLCTMILLRAPPMKLSLIRLVGSEEALDGWRVRDPVARTAAHARTANRRPRRIDECAPVFGISQRPVGPLPVLHPPAGSLSDAGRESSLRTARGAQNSSRDPPVAASHMYIASFALINVHLHMNLIFASSSDQLRKYAIEQIQDKFELTDAGPLTWILGSTV